MATSGTVEGNSLNGEGTYTDWQLVGQDVGGNFSVINWQTGWRYPPFTCRGLRLGNTDINGVNVWNNSASGDGVHAFNSNHLTSGGQHTPKKEFASGQLVIGHNADGTKTFGITNSIRGWEGGGPNFLSSGGGSFDLPTIPRFSSPPSTPVISSITQNSFFVTFSDGGGGAPIDSRQIRYGTNGDGSGATIVSSDGSTSITGLAAGTTYYVWARTHNSAGFSDWSSRAQATTLNVPAAPNAPVLSEVKQTSVKVTWNTPSNGGSAITFYQLAWNTTGVTPGSGLVFSSGITITNLDPATTYYFWVRAHNAIGAGAWSPRAQVKTIAGARIRIGGVWKDAIPYVKDAGVWKLARPWDKVLGAWKETI